MCFRPSSDDGSIVITNDTQTNKSFANKTSPAIPKLRSGFNPYPHVFLMIISNSDNSYMKHSSKIKNAIYELLPGRRRAFVKEMTINTIKNNRFAVGPLITRLHKGIIQLKKFPA